MTVAPLRLELVDRLRERRGFDIAAAGERRGEEVHDHGPLLQCGGQVEGERLAGQVGRRLEQWGLGAWLERGEAGRGKQAGEGERGVATGHAGGSGAEPPRYAMRVMALVSDA
jgi:hypothetical protein